MGISWLRSSLQRNAGDKKMNYLAQIWFQHKERWPRLSFSTYNHTEALDYQQKLEYKIGYSCWIVYQ